MQTKISKIKRWGNGTAIRLDKELLGALGVTADSEVELSVKNGVLSVRARRRPELEQLFAGYEGTPESYLIEHETRDWLEMKPAGRELW